MKRIKRYKLSRQFRIAVKLSTVPAYRLAIAAEVRPGWFYRAFSGVDSFRPSDYRIIAIGELLGLKPEECFEESTDD